MSTIIEEKRNNAINNNKPAQTELLTFIKGITPSTEVLNIPNELHGDLDFSILAENGLGNIKTIKLNKGEITSIIGLPNGLLILECPGNLLTTIENLPITLQTLNLSNNYLEKIDISSLEVLEILNISHNKITNLENIPSTIKELYCDNNEIGSLSFHDITGLKSLHISNNPITLIENLPDNIVDFQMDNTPSIVFRKSSLDVFDKNDENSDENNKDNNEKSSQEEEKDREQKKNYEEALFEYFQLKKDYEAKVRKMKKDAYRKAPTKKMGKQAVLSVKPPCISCKRPVGTIFGKRDGNKYVALCGDTESPCNLNIQIFNGYTSDFLELLYIFYEEVNEVKEKIIRQKLDTIFNYTSEDKSIELFKKEIKNYNDLSATFKEMYDKYIEYYHNPNNKELLIKKNEKLFLLIQENKQILEDYKSSQNPELLKIAIKSQIENIYPEIKNKRLLEGEVIELDSKSVGNNLEYSIFKYPIEISKIVEIMGEGSRVAKYNL